jgi:hypothetical protein
VWAFLADRGYRWHALGPDARLLLVKSWSGQPLNLFALPEGSAQGCAALLLSS